MSFVFLMAFGLFAGTAFALKYKIEHFKDGRCKLTIQYDNGKPYVTAEGSSVKDSNGNKTGCKTSEMNPGKPDDLFSYVSPVLGTKNSDAVRTIQTVLVNNGIPTVIDGNFGSVTQRGLKSFQRQNGIPATGMFDAKTRVLMEKSLSIQPPNLPVEKPLQPIPIIIN